MPNVFKGINNWSIKAFISTKSPNVIDPSTTPDEAKIIINVTPIVIMIAWPKFNNDMVVILCIAAVSHLNKTSPYLFISYRSLLKYFTVS